MPHPELMIIGLLCLILAKMFPEKSFDRIFFGFWYVVALVGWLVVTL